LSLKLALKENQADSIGWKSQVLYEMRGSTAETEACVHWNHMLLHLNNPTARFNPLIGLTISAVSSANLKTGSFLQQ